MLADLHQHFKHAFQHTADFIVRAPGRVNLIGEHTDYNDGFVLPCAIQYETRIAVSRRSDDQIHVVALDYQQSDQFALDAPIVPHQHYVWANYVRGVMLFLQQRGMKLCGLNLAITGNIPRGTGLSSSASLEVAVGLAATHGTDQQIALSELALIGQQAENQFVGCQCGIMDQMISALGQAGHALLLDCRSLVTQAVPLPDGLAIVIINSCVQRGLVDSEYNTRRQQCEAAARHFGVHALRDVTPQQWTDAATGLDTITFQRARHVMTENQRTLDAAAALKKGDLRKMGQLMAASHASMRDDFAITVPPIDALVDIIAPVIGEQGGVRMTGGGFGGCVVALTDPSKVALIRQAVTSQYPLHSGGLQAEIHVCQASSGAGLLE